MFPESEERRKIAYILRFWNKKPTTAEQESLAQSVGHSRSVTYRVFTKLMENGLFSKDTGSVPLYRYMEKKRLGVEGSGLPTPSGASGANGANRGKTPHSEGAKDPEKPK